MKTLTRLLLAAAAVAALAVTTITASAAPTQVSGSTFVPPQDYDRTDGVKLERYSRSPYMIENGQSAGPRGVGYRETFAYGASKGMTQLDQSGGATCVGNTTTVPCLVTFGDGVTLAWAPVVTATLPLNMLSTGLDIGGDQVADDGNEIFGGILGASGRPFVIGDDPDFYFCAQVALADVTGSDDFHVGFRRAEPMNAVFDNYLDLASIGSISGNVTIETILNNAATTTTDTTIDWADAETHTLCVGVADTGGVAYSYDSAAPTVTAAFTFDDGDPVIPFIHLLQDTDLMDTAVIKLWQVGYCLADGKSGVAERVCDAIR